ncbi:Bug family tripartite tricarboxylate transporter substrate binding protein [Caenimonas aquaedulcis]|uniref:Tripartite tricarboxylate transporter substrate binding protein n=1 Tax=Caenimonas aquaedulcis TaxID=2793270 RepID=A0A931H8V6_9BURK|nr:tripartite tricarboxylate transporter substrate binding protein [Caenimonas aquaedulcis]MBG9390465.1 tripartite tricarboxylate transporter substrate binding protein [Caenimonas aquaedulcis]
MRETDIHRRDLILALAAAIVGSAPRAAELGKSGTIKLVVPFAPAGATDIIARAIAPRLGEKLGAQIVVINAAGASGTIGAASVANAEPDGNTLLLYHIAMVTTHHFQKGMPFDPLNSFTPIGLVAQASNVVTVNPALPARNLRELVDYAKANPGKVNFGSSGVGSSDHLGGELLQSVTRTQLTHVPYKGGGPAIAGLVGGETEVNAGSIAQVVAMVKAGRLRALAVMQSSRSATLPDIPTTGEAGFPALDHRTWLGVWGPAKMTPDVVNRINGALRDVLAMDDVRQAFEKVGVDPAVSSPQEFDSYIRTQHGLWNKVFAGKAP